ncbi:MAG TPA: putative toxin-antitoxin system toxin component, PIN family, partial [Thermomicrobiales bacterium]|nr:putative toxin-antitoxin system toxin component, PIN family [Thermomicrobiales bacterium]
IRAVLDANVLVSGMLGYDRPGSKPGSLFRHIGRQTLRPVLSDWLLGEVAETLAEPYFQRSIGVDRIGALIALLRRHGEFCALTVRVEGVAPDPDDDPVISTALSADVRYLVTGDKTLRRVSEHAGVVILTPGEFLELRLFDEG